MLLIPARRPCDAEEWLRRRLRELAPYRESRALPCAELARKPARDRARDRCAAVRRREHS
ncbi:MAG TPA: hypothetical protein VK761_11035 [Solirubrobacteraceae bacterium]|nr:hypothetical protein [Solirubrobacteraceae bacterium]